MIKLALTITIFIVIGALAALNAKSPAGNGPKPQSDASQTPEDLPETRITDFTFVFTDGE